MYGLDVGDEGLLRNRSWRWLRARIVGLLAADTRTTRHFAPVPTPQEGGDDLGAEHR